MDINCGAVERCICMSIFALPLLSYQGMFAVSFVLQAMMFNLEVRKATRHGKLSLEFSMVDLFQLDGMLFCSIQKKKNTYGRL